MVREVLDDLYLQVNFASKDFREIIERFDETSGVTIILTVEEERKCCRQLAQHRENALQGRHVGAKAQHDAQLKIGEQMPNRVQKGEQITENRMTIIQFLRKNSDLLYNSR